MYAIFVVMVSRIMKVGSDYVFLVHKNLQISQICKSFSVCLLLTPFDLFQNHRIEAIGMYCRYIHSIGN